MIDSDSELTQGWGYLKDLEDLMDLPDGLLEEK